MGVLRNPDILDGKIRYERQNFAIAQLLLQKDTAVSAGDTVIIKGRYTAGGSTEVGTNDNNGITVNGTKQFTSSGVTFQTDGIAQYDILFIKEGEFRGTYVIDSVDSETQLTLIASANFTAEANLTYEIWTADIFTGTVDEQDFSKTKLILCNSEADEQDALIPSATYYGRDGGLIQDLLDSGDLAFINHTFTQTADYNYRAPHNWIDITQDQQPDADYWDDIGEVGGAAVRIYNNIGNVAKTCWLHYDGDNNQVRLKTTNMVISSANGTIIDFHVRFGSTTQQGEMDGEDDDSNRFWLRINADGKFGIPGVNTRSYSANTWYHIRFTLSDSTYRVDIDDVNYGGNINYELGGGSAYFEFSSHSQLGVTDKEYFIAAIGCTTDNNYGGDVNLIKQYHELTYSGNYTEFSKWIMRGDKTFKQYFDDYIESIYGTWYYLPNYEILFNDGDVDSGVDIDITTPETWGIIGKLQVKAYDKVILLGGYSGSARIISSAGAGNIVYKDTYAHIQKQEVLDALAIQILTREGNNPKTCELYMRYFDKGYIQIGEEVTIKANTIKFLNSGDFVETGDTQYKIRKEIYYISNGIHTYTYYELDDVLIFLASEDREVTREDQENAVLVDQVAGGESVGEANTGSNIGVDGVGVYASKSGATLQFRNIAPASSMITVTENGNDIDLDVVIGNIALDDLGVPDAMVDMNDQDLDNVGSILFDITNGIASEEGRLKWNPTDGTLEVGMPGGNVNLQIGQEMLIKCKNTSGSTIGNGKCVRISGVSGNNPEIELAEADVPGKAGVIGLATEEILHNQFGYVTTFGFVRDVDTSGFNAGDRLFLSNTAGELTITPPTGTERIVFVGLAINIDGSEGSVFLLPINVSHLGELSSVTISSPTDNELLAFDSGNGIWINQTFAELNIYNKTEIDGLDDSHQAAAESTAAAALAAHHSGVTNEHDGIYDTKAQVTAKANAKVSNDVYDGAGWNGVQTIAPSKDAVRDVIEAFTAAIFYQGTWDPADAYPATGSGYYYIVDTDGYHAIDGNTPARWYEVGDWIIYNAILTKWDVLRNTTGDNIIKVAAGDDIQIAIDEIEAIGDGKIILLAGTHVLTAMLTVSNAGVDITMEGMGRATIIETGDRTGIYVESANSAVFRHFAMDTSDMTGASKGILTDQLMDITVDSIHITGGVGLKGYGIQFFNEVGFTDEQLTIINCTVESMEIGIYGCQYCKIINNSVYNCKEWGILGQEYSTIIGNIVDGNNDTTIGISGDSVSTVMGNVIRDCDTGLVTNINCHVYGNELSDSNTIQWTRNGSEIAAQYDGTDLILSGGSGDIKSIDDLDMNTHTIKGVVDPTNNQDAATKKYVDDNAGGSLDDAFEVGKIIDGADSLVNAVQIGEATDRIKLWHDGSNPYVDYGAGTPVFNCLGGFYYFRYNGANMYYLGDSKIAVYNNKLRNIGSLTNAFDNVYADDFVNRGIKYLESSDLYDRFKAMEIRPHPTIKNSVGDPEIDNNYLIREFVGKDRHIKQFKRKFVDKVAAKRNIKSIDAETICKSYSKEEDVPEDIRDFYFENPDNLNEQDFGNSIGQWSMVNTIILKELITRNEDLEERIIELEKKR